MKVWFHIIAVLVGFLTAGLIVFLVFGTASREGATQDGAAPGIEATSETLCGTIAPADTATPATIAKAKDHLPAIIDPTGKQIAGFARPNQQAWINRVAAASGFCLDEIEIADTTKMTLSTVKDVSDDEAAAFTGAALMASFQEPLNRPQVEVITYVGDQRRSVAMSERAYLAFSTWQRVNGASSSVTDLVRFSRTARLGAANLRILGWS